MNLETKIIIYKFTPQVFTLTQEKPLRLFLQGRGVRESLLVFLFLYSSHFLYILSRLYFFFVSLCRIPIKNKQQL